MCMCRNPAGLFQTNHSKVKDNLCPHRSFRSSDFGFHSRDSHTLPSEFPPHWLLSENQHHVPCDRVLWTDICTLSQHGTIKRTETDGVLGGTFLGGGGQKSLHLTTESERTCQVGHSLRPKLRTVLSRYFI